MDTTLHDHYVRSSNRLLFLDYDGTLVGFRPLPEQAVPSKRVLKVLAQLAADPANELVIISGRDREFLDQVLGHLPLHLAAEHGVFTKTAGRQWQSDREVGNDWKDTIRPILQDAAATHPGSLIEEKASALVWHYRRGPRSAESAAHRLHRQLQAQSPQLGLKSVPGHKVLEVRVASADKGQAAQYWLGPAAHDFVLAAGDDTTDEDLFAAMPPEAYTIKIGRGHSQASLHLTGPGALIKLLEQLSLISSQSVKPPI
ncbi:MAG TPA: trehalose-phosphatase [Candidatus Saccharimonadia bacterium]